MNWMRIVLDGIAMSLVFNAIIGMFWFIIPHAYARMLPKEIERAAAPYTKKESCALAAVIYLPFIGIIAWMILSAFNSGTEGFGNLFWTAYVESLFINFGDFLILDCYLMSIVRKKYRLKATEDCKAWEFKEYMKSAAPEHFLLWPLIICPIVSLICAGVGVWIA